MYMSMDARRIAMKKRSISIVILLLTMVLMMSMTGLAAAKAKKIKLNKKKITMSVGETRTLIAKVKPASASQKVRWISSNKKVATVSSAGKVKAKAAGTAVITCRSRKNPKAKAVCKVTVKKANSNKDKNSDSNTEDTTKANTLTDSTELAAIKQILGCTGEPLHERFQNNKVSVKRSSSGLTIWSVGTSANGVVKNIKVYNDTGSMTGYTYCNAWGSPSVTYSKEVQSDHSSLKDGSYSFASDPSGVLAGWGMWNASTTQEEFHKMINSSISAEVFELVKETFSNSFYFSASGGGSTIILYGKDPQGQLIGKYAGVVSYNMSSNSLYFRVKGINPGNTDDYGKNFYEELTW